MGRAKLASELYRVRRSLAAAKSKRMLLVESVDWLGERDEAVLHLPAAGWTPQAGDVVEVNDAAGMNAVFRIVSTRGLLAMGSPCTVVAKLLGPVPRKLVRLRARERELEAVLTTVMTRVEHRERWNRRPA